MVDEITKEEEIILEYDREYQKIKNPIRPDGTHKEYRLSVLSWYSFEDGDEDLIPNSRTIGYFDSIQDIKDFMSRYKSSIDETYDDVEEFEYSINMCNKPFPKQFNEKRFKERQGYEDGMLYCPYCGKWRYFFEDENGYESCTACGVSVDNYNVEEWRIYRG